MIMPCPVLPRDWLRFPVTVSLVAANVMVFVLFFWATPESNHLSDQVSDRDLRTAGRLYLAERFRPWHPEWMDGSLAQAPETLETYGQMALHDRRFLQTLEKGELSGPDPLAIRSLVKSANGFHQDLEERALHRFGLSSEREQSFTWLTYQFSHAGILHLVSNMAFLLLLGFVLETQIGGLPLLFLYLFGGIAGGLFFLHLDPYGVIPMVGASGSVSALIAAYPLLEPRRRIRYYYFILPFRGQHGFIYLPTLLIFPLFVVSDVASLLASPRGLMSGVAYSAHLGGALFGVLFALGLRLWQAKSRLSATS